METQAIPRIPASIAIPQEEPQDLLQTNINIDVVDAISLVFGPNADLYQEVLGVDRDATSREIRAAYFKRCRESLFEQRNIVNMSTITSVSNKTKLKFQAVSYAYDVLSNPVTKHQYDTMGIIPQLQSDSSLLTKHKNDHADRKLNNNKLIIHENIPLSIWGVDILSRNQQIINNHQIHYNKENNSYEYQDSKLLKNSVHWNEEVHELLIIDHDEYDYIENEKEDTANSACCGWFFFES